MKKGKDPYGSQVKYWKSLQESPAGWWEMVARDTTGYQMTTETDIFSRPVKTDAGLRGVCEHEPGGAGGSFAEHGAGGRA